MLHRADIRRMLAEYGAADARLRLEIANQYPNVSLTPAYSLQEGFAAYTLGSAIDSLPIFHYNQGPIAEAEAARAEIRARFVALQAGAIGDTESAIRQYRAAVQQWLEARDHLQVVQHQRESAVLAAFHEGEADRLDLTLARSFTLAADQTRLDALLRVQNALGALENAVQVPLEDWLEPFRNTISWSGTGSLEMRSPVLILFSLALLTGCGQQPDMDDVHEQAKQSPAVIQPNTEESEPGVTLKKEAQARAGLKIEPLAPQSAEPELTAFGKLEEDPSASFVVRAPVAGTVHAIPARAWPALGRKRFAKFSSWSTRTSALTHRSPQFHHSARNRTRRSEFKPRIGYSCAIGVRSH